MILAPSFQISPRISGRRNSRNPVGAAGVPRDVTEVAELSIIGVGSEFQLLCRDRIAEGEILHKILQVEAHPLPSSQKFRGKGSCKFQSKWCLGWCAVEGHAGTSPAAPGLQGLIAASWAPHGKINGCCKSSSLNVCQEFLVFLENIFCIIYR